MMATNGKSGAFPVGGSVAILARFRFLGITPSYFGYVPCDDYLRQAIRRQATVVEAFPSSPSARAFQRLALIADGWAPATEARGGVEFFTERLVRPGAEPMAGVQ